MALADDFFTEAVEASVGAAADDMSELHAPAADGADSSAPPRRSRPGRARKVVEQEGQLARMVRELREIEDGISSKLGSVERLLAQLESRRVHEDGGYASADEFEERMLASTPALRAMRETFPRDANAEPATHSRAKLTLARREPHDARTRQTKALTTIARALDRIRNVDSEIHRAASQARVTLHAIEGMRVYDECGYASFEEFLERALGPSPVLSAAVALLSDEALLPTGADGDALGSAAQSLSGPDTDHQDFPSSLFSDGLDSGNETQIDQGDPEAVDAGEPTHVGDAKPAASPSADAKASLAPAERWSTRVIVSVVLCAAAAVGGAAAGIGSARLAMASSVAPAPSAVEATPTAPTVIRAPGGLHTSAVAAPATGHAEAARDHRD